jgi:hypothetical protein
VDKGQSTENNAQATISVRGQLDRERLKDELGRISEREILFPNMQDGD